MSLASTQLTWTSVHQIDIIDILAVTKGNQVNRKLSMKIKPNHLQITELLLFLYLLQALSAAPVTSSILVEKIAGSPLAPPPLCAREKGRGQAGQCRELWLSSSRTKVTVQIWTISIQTNPISRLKIYRYIFFMSIYRLFRIQGVGAGEHWKHAGLHLYCSSSGGASSPPF